jgi:hypothetical protein
MKFVKHLLIATALLLLTTIAAYAQQSANPTPNSASDPVIVQGCERALSEVQVSRPLIQELKTEVTMGAETITAYKAALDAAHAVIAAKDEVIAAKDETIHVQAKLIDKHEARIEKLEKRGSGGKLKTALAVIAGIVTAVILK